MSTDTLVADRIEIADLVIRFARLLDERRWEDAGTIFAADAAVHSPRGGELRGIDEIVGFLRQGSVEAEHTQHTTTDLLVDIDGDRADCSVNSVVYYYRDGEAPHFIGGLRQAYVAVRTQEGWRVGDVRTMPAGVRKS